MDEPSANSVEYWEEFYHDRRLPYDTLCSYDQFGPVISRKLRNLFGEKADARYSIRVLHVGCGTSDVTNELWKHGFRDIMNIDFSQKCIDLMRERWEDRAALNTSEVESESMLRRVQWRQMDLADLCELTDGSIDMVIEKFTLDAILCEAGDDSNSDQGMACMCEIHRVLAPGGCLVSVAWGTKTRLGLLEKDGLFNVDYQRLPDHGPTSKKPLMYLCKKRKDAVATTLGGYPKASPPRQIEPVEPSWQGTQGGSVISVESHGNIEVWVDFRGFDFLVRNENVELDLGEQDIQWCIRQFHSSSHDLCFPGAVHLPKKVDMERAKVHWTKSPPPVKPLESQDLGEQQQRMLRIVAPAL